MALPNHNPRNTVVVDFGKVTAASEESQVGKFLFFVAWCDENGSELGLHNTPLHAEAIRLAADAKRDFRAFAILDRSSGKDSAP